MISDNLDSSLFHSYPDLLGSINNDLLEFVEFVLALFQSFHDLGFQSVQFVLEEVTDLGIRFLDGSFYLVPDITDSSLVQHSLIRCNDVVSNKDLSDVIDDTDDDLFSRLDQDFLHPVQLFQDLLFVLIDDGLDNGLDVVGQFLGSILNLGPDASQLVLDSIADGIRYSAGDSSDDSDDFSFDLKVDFLSSINYNGLGFVQSFDDLGFVLLDLCNDVVLDISLQLLGGSSGFLVDIIGIFHDLDTEFVDADMDFLGFIDNEIFVVFNIITEFVQGGDDLWLVFLNLGFDVPVSDEVLDSGLNFVPDSIGIFDNLDSEFVDTNVDFL